MTYAARRHLVVLFSLLVSFFSFTSDLSAREPSASINNFLPAIDPSAYLTVYGSQTLQPWRYQFGTSFNYAKAPLQVGLGGNSNFTIVDNLIMADFFGSLGITDWFQIGLDVPVALSEEIEDASILNGGVSASTKRVTSMGDVRLETKFRVLDIDRHHVGIAVLPYILFPTGNGDNLVGNNTFAGGGKAIIDFDILNRVYISGNFGYLARSDVTILNTQIADQFTFGMGVDVKAAEILDLVGEVYGSTTASDMFKQEQETPVEADGALRFNLPKPEGLVITAGGGAGLSYGYGTPQWRGFLQVTYPNPRHVDLPPPPPLPPEDTIAKVDHQKIAIVRRVHFEFDKWTIRPISFQILDAVVDILKQHPSITKVRVEGYCDDIGSVKYNLRLSQRRADAVRDYLIGHGITADRLIAIGYGKSRPIATNETPEGRARNRRVEFTILDQAGVSTPTAL
jgi:outer membrane protein OmpA-like peptidoglycan-associated protein